ncbi:hypothetical protein LJK87_35300 [Paenibacillus sp. P25]|nr:hypothetical protein LJK87_35300 [Paenibacillus sp. P25]
MRSAADLETAVLTGGRRESHLQRAEEKSAMIIIEGGNASFDPGGLSPVELGIYQEKMQSSVPYHYDTAEALRFELKAAGGHCQRIRSAGTIAGGVLVIPAVPV